MSTPTTSDRDRQSFAETALRLGGKTEEEARRTGAVDKADEQVESLFAPQYQTVNSPVHQAVWDGSVPLDLFTPPPLPASAPCDAAMERCLEIVRRRRDAGTLLRRATARCRRRCSKSWARPGYWGMLIDPQLRRPGSAVRALHPLPDAHGDASTPMVAGLASVHGCIGAVDPVRTFGNADQKAALLARAWPAAQALSGFALTEPGAGSDLTALRTTAVAGRRPSTRSPAKSCSSPTPFPAGPSAWW